jgi:hypothetical protein
MVLMDGREKIGNCIAIAQARGIAEAMPTHNRNKKPIYGTASRR